MAVPRAPRPISRPAAMTVMPITSAMFSIAMVFSVSQRSKKERVQINQWCSAAMLRYTMVSIMKMNACSVMTSTWKAVQMKSATNWTGIMT